MREIKKSTWGDNSKMYSSPKVRVVEMCTHAALLAGSKGSRINDAESEIDNIFDFDE